MTPSEGVRLAQTIQQKLEEMNRVCEGLDEATASRAPAGRWSPREIISHLCGPEGIGVMPALQAILKIDTPRLDMEAADPYYTGKRPQLTFTELLSQLNEEYGRMAELVTGLSVEQLARKGHIPLFKETPMGEYPTLAMFVGALAEYHLDDHINHMKEIIQLLGVASAPQK
ncbi:MAG: maleylpyruvate isomerase [Desulfobacca sp.]|nr:maleylpyruvate isomerase [Desulfobacca sp.]